MAEQNLTSRGQRLSFGCLLLQEMTKKTTASESGLDDERCSPMRTKKKILLGVVALTLPLATMATFGQAAMAAKAPPNPINCSLSATVSISPALSVSGTPSAKGQFGTATVNGTLFNCSAASGPVGNISVPILVNFPAAKDKNWQSDGNTKTGYYLGVCGSFASSATIKDLSKAVKNLPFQGGELKGVKASEGSVGADVGFILGNGTVKGGTYPTASHGASIQAGLTNDANNGNLISGCPAGPVDHIDIDSSASTATL